MQVLIELPFFPGFDDEAPLSIYEHCDPDEWVIKEKLQEIQEKCSAAELTYSDLSFNQKDYEKAAKTAWIEEWGKRAPRDIVESIVAVTDGYFFNYRSAWATVELKEDWQEVMSAFMQDNETWLKENCDDEDQEHYLESQDFRNWPKHLFQDYDRDAIADMIGLMMLRDYDDIDDISYDLIAGALNSIDIRSYVFLTEEGLVKLVESEGDEQDEEIRILSNVKKWYELLATDCSNKDYFSSLIDVDRTGEYLGNLQSFVDEKYRQEWYKNYIGTKIITFDGPTNYKETGEITDNDISAFMDGYWKDFLNYRLKVGHTKRQDSFTALMRDYPQEILDWMQGSIPSPFYAGLAKGGEYELYGCSKDEFINILRGKDFDEKDEEFEYAAVLEEVFGIDYAVDYLIALNWDYWLFELPDDSATFIIDIFDKAVSLGDNMEALKAVGYIALHRNGDGRFNLDQSLDMYSRLAALWRKRLISDNWLTDDSYGVAGIFDWVWGSLWDDGDYPECPDEDDYRLWLLKLLESDFAEDIADYLKPLLEQVLEREKNHNWEIGKKAIKSFLAKTANK